MSNIDKQALRADALEATGGSWVRESGEGWEAICCDDDQGNAGFIIAEFQGENATANRKFVQSANPATVLALLDELETAEKRIAELEAREIKPAKGEVLVVVSGFTGCGKSAIAGEIEIAMKAIGVPVQWTNGDAEKRMTGADWLTAIEMYKPTVRIVEVNVPRAAGIGVKGE